MSKKVSVDRVLKNGKLIFTFPIIHLEWNGDETGLVYEMPDKSRYIILSEFGEHYIAPPEILEHLIDQYSAAASLTQTAIELLMGVDDGKH